MGREPVIPGAKVTFAETVFSLFGQSKVPTKYMYARFTLRTFLAAVAIVSIIFVYAAKPFILQWQKSRHLADLRAHFSSLRFDFEKRIASSRPKLPFDEGEALGQTAIPWKPGEKRPSVALISVCDPDDQVADDSAWFFYCDEKRRKYWAHFYPGKTTMDRYKMTSVVVGPFDFP